MHNMVRTKQKIFKQACQSFSVPSVGGNKQSVTIYRDNLICKRSCFLLFKVCDVEKRLEEFQPLIYPAAALDVTEGSLIPSERNAT